MVSIGTPIIRSIESGHRFRWYGPVAGTAGLNPAGAPGACAGSASLQSEKGQLRLQRQIPGRPESRETRPRPPRPSAIFRSRHRLSRGIARTGRAVVLPRNQLIAAIIGKKVAEIFVRERGNAAGTIPGVRWIDAIIFLVGFLPVPGKRLPVWKGGRRRKRSKTDRPGRAAPWTTCRQRGLAS